MRKVLTVLVAAMVLAAVPAAAPAAEGNFLISCGFDHEAAQDPIGGANHTHDFMGALGVTNLSMPSQLLRGGTTCTVPGETAAVWHPNIIAPDGTPVHYSYGSIYYRNFNAASGPVMPFPFGFKTVVGNPANQNPNTYAATYRCQGAGNDSVFIPTSCPGGQGFEESFYAPQCWNGLTLDAPDHHTLAPCDAAHPILMPSINLSLEWPQSAVGGKLSSDIEHGTPAGLSAHFDYWATYDPFFFTKVTERCLNAGIQCRVAGPGENNPQGSIVNFSAPSPKPMVLTAAEARGPYH